MCRATKRALAVVCVAAGLLCMAGCELNYRSAGKGSKPPVGGVGANAVRPSSAASAAVAPASSAAVAPASSGANVADHAAGEGVDPSYMETSGAAASAAAVPIPVASATPVPAVSASASAAPVSSGNVTH